MMMISHRPTRYDGFLIRTDVQEAEFRERYRQFILRHYEEYTRWIDSLPLCTRTPYLAGVPDKAVPAVIGLICLLHIDGRVNIQFSEDMTKISRQPASLEEWEAWCDSQMPKRTAYVSSAKNYLP